jgi:nitrogen regulatory protein PII
MKTIKAIVQPFQLSAVVEALQQIPDLPSLTVSDVRGFARRRARDTRDDLEDEGTLYVKKVQIDIAVPDRLVEEVTRAIRESAHTGQPGDGKIFVGSLDDAIRIRSGECGDAAL